MTDSPSRARVRVRCRREEEERDSPPPRDQWSGLEKLLSTSIVFPANVRPQSYQKDAVSAVDRAIAAGMREILLAMATGTDKTRVAIALLYRFLKLGRFRRVLFLVDRESLGGQAADRFKGLRLENLQTFADIYDIK